ncbi:MAG: hypothetical protein ACRC42_01135 [Mycoplasma sp.]
MKTKLSTNVENFLQSPKGYKKSWFRVIAISTIAMIIFSIILGLSYTYGPLSIPPPPPEEPDAETFRFPLDKILQENPYFINTATWLSIAGFAIVGCPLIYVFAVWIVGVNKPSRTPYFHIFLWLVTFVLSVLAVVALIFFIRATIHNLVVDPGETGGGDTEAWFRNIALGIK